MFGSLDLSDRRMPDEMADLHRCLLLAIIEQQSGLARKSRKSHRLHHKRIFFLASGQYVHETPSIPHELPNMNGVNSGWKAPVELRDKTANPG
ncbi:hypothetical protein LJR257_004733 [Ensifer adhaerens]